jgi:hypothetical protein
METGCVFVWYCRYNSCWFYLNLIWSINDLLLTFWYLQSTTVNTQHDSDKTEHGIKSLPRTCKIMVVIQSFAECTRNIFWIQKSLSSSHGCEIGAVMNYIRTEVVQLSQHSTLANSNLRASIHTNVTSQLMIGLTLLFTFILVYLVKWQITETGPTTSLAPSFLCHPLLTHIM